MRHPIGRNGERRRPQRLGRDLTTEQAGRAFTRRYRGEAILADRLEVQEREEPFDGFVHAEKYRPARQRSSTWGLAVSVARGVSRDLDSRPVSRDPDTVASGTWDAWDRLLHQDDV